MSVVGYFIPVCSYHFVVAVWRTKRQNHGMKTSIPKSLIVVLIVCLGPLQNAPGQCPSSCMNDNTAIGGALQNTTTGRFNTAIGYVSLRLNTTGSGNTATGYQALYSSTTGDSNTANGVYALNRNTVGFNNTAIGAQALIGNTTGSANTATGVNALAGNTTASGNTANGASALTNNTGANNTAIGASALQNNTTGNANTAEGFWALSSNTTGGGNTANGQVALFSNTTGIDNTANGAVALLNNTTGTGNTADGYRTLVFNTTGEGNTAEGIFALLNNTTGSDNVAVGLEAGMNATTGSGNVYIGSGMQGVAGESNACYIASIFGQTSVNGVPILINSSNQLGTATSSARFKRDIHNMDKASEALFALRPVAFRYNEDIDPAGLSQLGLVAEDVEKVNPDLVVRDKEGKPYSVRYDQVNAMLLNEFLKEHRRNDQQEATIARQQKQIDALAAALQKVSAQLELNKPAPQTVVNNQ